MNLEALVQLTSYWRLLCYAILIGLCVTSVRHGLHVPKGMLLLWFCATFIFTALTYNGFAAQAQVFSAVVMTPMVTAFVGVWFLNVRKEGARQVRAEHKKDSS